MTKVAYLDCPTGISGDMCLGALVHAGVPLEYLTQQLSRLGLSHEYHLRAELVQRNGQQATKIEVELLNEVQPSNHSPSSHSNITPSPVAQARAADSTHPSDHSHPHSHLHSHSYSHSHSHKSDSLHWHHKTTQLAHGHTRHLPEIEQLILTANLPERATQWSLAVFRRLAEAEGAVHGIDPAQVHFHEVGATDAIVDIVGTCLGLDWLGIEQLYCSALPTGGGTLWAAHGHLPVPAPAVLKLWEIRQIPIYSNGIAKELVTPTGAAIVTTLATQFGTIPAMQLQKVGLGAGSKDLAIPNILRLWIGEATGDQTAQSINISQQPHRHGSSHSPGHSPGHSCVDDHTHSHDDHDYSHAYSQLGINSSAASVASLAQTIEPHRAFAAIPQREFEIDSAAAQETVTLLETQVDDLSPQAIGYVMTELLQSGALDVFTQAVGMKKSRPGVLLTVICYPEQAAVCEAILFRETTTLGVRQSIQQRKALERHFETVQTAYGAVKIKVAQLGGAVMNVQPEYEDCARLAQQHRLAWREIHQLALRAWHEQKQAKAPI